MSWMQWASCVSVCLAAFGCSTAVEIDEPPALGTTSSELSTDLTAGDPEPDGPGDITTIPVSSELHIGCNRNTSCRGNCMWCGIHQCTCRLKGIP